MSYLIYTFVHLSVGYCFNILSWQLVYIKMKKEADYRAKYKAYKNKMQRFKNDYAVLKSKHRLANRMALIFWPFMLLHLVLILFFRQIKKLRNDGR